MAWLAASAVFAMQHRRSVTAPRPARAATQQSGDMREWNVPIQRSGVTGDHLHTATHCGATSYDVIQTTGVPGIDHALYSGTPLDSVPLSGSHEATHAYHRHTPQRNPLQ
jgi:hypothetical protein